MTEEYAEIRNQKGELVALARGVSSDRLDDVARNYLIQHGFGVGCVSVNNIKEKRFTELKEEAGELEVIEV